MNQNRSLPEQKGIHFFREECSNSAYFMPVSVWQTVLKNFHTSWVRSLADSTKVVTMAALRKFAGLETSKSLILSRFSSSFSAFRSWKSPTASSSTEHKSAACWNCWIVNSSPSCRFIFFASRRVMFLSDRKEFLRWYGKGVSEGKDGVLGKLRGFDRSADCDLGRGIW